jgi:hypothetical protein
MDFVKPGRVLMLAGMFVVSRFHLVPSHPSPNCRRPHLRAFVSRATIETLRWNAATDQQTPAPGLTYNLRVGTTPGGAEIISPHSRPDGYQ